MGLDVYIHKIVKPRTKNISSREDWEKIFKQADDDSRKELTKVYDGAVRSLKRTKPENYNAAYERNIKKICAFSTYPQFHYKKLGVEYDYKDDKYIYTPVPVSVFEKERDEILKDHYAPYVGYFRKVNFFYHYFAEKLVDETAWIEREDLVDIIDRCEKVLEDHTLGPKLLPTQSGFFFGSTEYDDWYYNDVKDCLKQMKGLLKGLKDDEQLYVVMNW
jgi:hypothetical protein